MDKEVLQGVFHSRDTTYKVRIEMEDRISKQL